MVFVDFLGPIRLDAMSLDVCNLQELSNILKQDDKIVKWLANSAVAINDVIVDSINHELQDGDRVAILPPVCGG